MDDVGVLGKVRRRTSDSNDITDQYYDAQAHLKNDKIHEEGLQKLHEQKAEKGTLDEVLRLRDKLKEVRSQIDSQEGRIKLWDSQAAHSTVVVHLTQRREGEVVGPVAFGTTVAR